MLQSHHAARRSPPGLAAFVMRVEQCARSRPRQAQALDQSPRPHHETNLNCCSLSHVPGIHLRRWNERQLKVNAAGLSPAAVKAAPAFIDEATKLP